MPSRWFKMCPKCILDFDICLQCLRFAFLPCVCVCVVQEPTKHRLTVAALGGVGVCIFKFKCVYRTHFTRLNHAKSNESRENAQNAACVRAWSSRRRTNRVRTMYVLSWITRIYIGGEYSAYLSAKTSARFALLNANTSIRAQSVSLPSSPCAYSAYR